MHFLTRSIFAITTLTMVSGVDVIVGHYKTWWSIVQLPKTVVQDMLPDPTYHLITPPISGLPASDHIIVFEMGTEIKTGPIFPEFLRETFQEFKYDIPFVAKGGSTTPLNNKQIVYVNSTVESIGSRLTYGLNASVAEFTVTNSSYDLKINGLAFKASFTAKGPWTDVAALKGFSAYESIMNISWFGEKATSCADHHYQYTSAKVRPASATIVADMGVVNSRFPSTPVVLPDLATNPLGTVQVDIHFEISTPHGCA